jgi:beta-ureidopropionase / N-carbamoyl-L-amino-acid hydrolase
MPAPRQWSYLWLPQTRSPLSGMQPNNLPLRKATSSQPSILTVDPSASNIVPGQCRLVIDARATDPALTRRLVEIDERESTDPAAAVRVTCASFTTLSDSKPIACDANLRTALRQGASGLGLADTDLPSGAGHDAAFMSRIYPSAMVFVPCRGGKSHAPEEWADREAIAAGAAVIYQAVKALDQSLALPA